MGWSHGHRWSEDEIRAQLVDVVRVLGRMPTANVSDHLSALWRYDAARGPR